MKTYIYQRLALLIAILLLITLAVGLSLAQAQAGQPKTIERNLEPVVRLGSQVASLLASPVDELFVYRFDGVTPAQIPVQVDEVTASGSYTTTEDGLLDGNDEIVFMAADLGGRPTDPATLLAALPISPTWSEIEVTDPLDPARHGWAYLVRSSQLTQPAADYAKYDGATQRITTSQYALGFAAAQPGLDYLDHNGSDNILDRSKLRVVGNFLGVAVPFNEEDLENPATILIKDGPVRVIAQQSVASTPGGIDLGSARVDTLHLAYAAMVYSTASISFTLLPFIDITSVRTSIDFNSHIASTGVATFYNSTIPGGVPIDGITDTVAATPVSLWGQVSHPYGRIVQVTDPAPIGGSPANYYCDNTDLPAECDGTSKTGDNMSYGDSGFSITGDINSRFVTESWLFFLPPPAPGEADNVGETYQDYFENPLDQSKIFLPLIVKIS